jgi:ornithine cyclodeaminase/alanine dehydrogenase
VAILLTEGDVSRLLTMREALDAVRDGFCSLAAGAGSNSPRARVRTGNAILNVMSAALGTVETTRGRNGSYLGVKSYSIARGKARFLVLLYAADGEILAIIEADRLGQIRTGAASGLATDAMARTGIRTVGIIGTGWQARSQLEAVAAVRPIQVARAFSRREEGRRAFSRDMEAKLGIEVIPVPTAEEAVSGADVVITITTSREPVLHGAWLREGAHVNAAGSNFPHRRELDEEAVGRARFIAVDSLEQARLESGDLIMAAEQGRLSWDRVHELGDVVTGKLAPRSADSDITLFKSNGIAIEDVAVAAHVYERAVVERVGKEVMLGNR